MSCFCITQWCLFLLLRDRWLRVYINTGGRKVCLVIPQCHQQMHMWKTPNSSSILCKVLLEIHCVGWSGKATCRRGRTQSQSQGTGSRKMYTREIRLKSRESMGSGGPGPSKAAKLQLYWLNHGIQGYLVRGVRMKEQTNKKLTYS